jgi:hypothetical protein
MICFQFAMKSTIKVNPWESSGDHPSPPLNIRKPVPFLTLDNTIDFGLRCSHRDQTIWTGIFSHHRFLGWGRWTFKENNLGERDRV